MAPIALVGIGKDKHAIQNPYFYSLVLILTSVRGIHDGIFVEIEQTSH